MKSITKRLISTLVLCGALVLEAGATAIGSLGKALNNIAKVDAVDPSYTLSFTKLTSGTNYNSYTAAHTYTCSSVTWSLFGNQSVGANIRVGGKNTSNTDRTLTSTNVVSSSSISKVVINHSGITNGKSSSITVNSIKIEGSTNSDFTGGKSKTISSPSVGSSGALEFKLDSGNWDANSYFRMTLNYKISGSNNSFLTVDSIEFFPKVDNELAKPSNITYKNGTLTWDAVEHATGYKISINGVAITTVNTNSKSITLSNADRVSIIATDSTSAYVDSEPAIFDYVNYGTETEPISVSDALKIAALHTNADVTDLAYVKGKLTENPTNTTYGNFHISDDGTSSNSLYVYGVTATTSAVSKDGNYWNFTNPKDFGTNSATKDLKSQDEAIFKLRLYNFSGTMEGDGLFVKMYVVKTNVDITGSDVAIKVGDADVAPTTNVTGYTLTSNNTSIVSIVNNKIHAVAEGNTTVTISKTEDNEHTYTSKTINVTVSAATEPYITPDKTAASGYTGTSEEVGVSYGNLLGTFNATSGNSSIATVSIKSNLSGRAVLTISYVAVGNATISLKDGANELATIAVSVSLSTVTISGMPATNSVYIDKTLDLGSLITVTPTGSCGSGVTWSTTDGGKATVDSNGVVTGVAAGTTTITATPDDYSAGAVSCIVTVSEAPLETTYDFVTNFNTYVENWGNTDKQSSYLDRSISYESLKSEYDATINLHYASKQGTTITTMPVFATKTGSGSYTDVLDFTLNETDYTISHIAVTFVQWASKTPDVALFSGTGASGTPLDSITISGTTLSLDADVEDLASFSIGYCDKNTGSNVQAGIASIDLQFKAKKSLTSIAVSNSHRSFDNGAEFVKETVTAHYSDSTSPTVSGATFKIKKDLEGSEFTDIPETLDMSYNNATVQVSYSDSYGSASTSYAINVHYAAASGVELNPTSTDVEKGKTFDLSGVAVTISPSTADPEDYEWSIKNKTEVSDSTLVGDIFTAGNNTGTVTLTCTAGSASADFVINVVDKPVPQITDFTAEGTPAKATQYRNATFALDLTGVTLKAVYDIKDPETIGSDQFDWDTTGAHPIGTYKLNEDLTVTVDSITLGDDFINSISFTASSDMSKKEYWVGDSWDFTGLAIEGKWASGLDLDVDTEKVSFSTTSTTSTAGEGLSIVVTAHYEGFEGTEPTLTVSGITIKEVEMESLSIDYTGGQPTLGEKFTFAGSITGNMSDGNTQPVDADDVTFSEIDKFITTEQTITVTHKTTGATGTFKVQYKAFEPQKTYEYQLVDSALEDYSGQYLIVYEPDSIAMPGNNATPGAAQAHVDISDYWVSDEHKAIEYNTSTSALSFTIEATEGGYYLYTTVDDSTVYIRSETSGKNGMQYASKPTANFINTFSYDNDTKETQLHGVFSTNILHYNDNAGTSGEMFRFYKDGGQKAVQYYKLVETGSEEADLIKLNVTCSKTFKEGETLNISDLTINGLYNDGNTKAITTGVTFSDGSSSKVLAPGDNNLTVKYGELTENITITATPLVKYDLSVTINDDQAEYTVSPALTDGKLIGGEDYTVEVSAKDGYVIESVTATGATVSGNTVTITNASSDVSITVTSRALETFNITYDGINAEYATISPKPTSIVEGEDLDLTVTANENKKIDAVVVTMDGVEQTGAYSDGKIHLDDVSGDIKITVDCSYITYEVDFSGSDEEITFNPATTEYNQGAEFNVTAEFSEFLYEIDLDNSSYSMEGGGTLSLVGNVLHADAVTGKITISLVLKEIPHEVEVDDSVEGYTISDISEDATGLTVTLALEEHYSALPSSIECTIEGTTGTKSYTVSDNKIVIPAEDVTGKVTLLTSATHADCSFVGGDIAGVEGSIISSPKDYKDNIDYTFTLKEGFDPETLTVTMTSYGSEFTDFELTKSGDTYHVKFVIVGDTVINIAAKAKITNDLTDTLVTTSNTDETIEVGEDYSATLSFADGCDPDKTTVKVEMRGSYGDLQDITASAYNSTTHEISISGVTGEIVVTAHTELKQFNVTLSGDNLLDSDYATVVVCVDGKPVTLDGGSVKVTYGEFVQISIELKDGKKYAEGYPIYTMGGSTEGLDWDDDGKLTVDSLTGDLSFVANLEKIGVSSSLQYDVTIIENTTSPVAIYQGEEVVYEFVIINPKAYEFDQETSKIETYVGGVLTDLTTESGVWYYDDNSGILRITISNPNTHVGIKIGHKDIEYTVTSPEDAKFYSLDVPETIHYGDKNVAIEVVADDHCHVDGVKVFLGEEELTLNVEYEYSNGVVTIKEIKGNYVIEAEAAHDDVTITLDSSSENIKFTLDDPQASYTYETTITGYFSVVAPYKLPGSIKVFEYGVEIGNDKYTYSPTTGVFSIKAEGDITIIAKGSLGTVTVGLSDESSANASLSPTPEAEYDEGASFEATVIVDSGYQIVSVVVKMGGNSIKAFNPYDNSIFILNLTGDVEITVVTEKIYCDVSIISYNGYSDGDAISSIEYGLPLEVTFTPDSGYHLDDYDTFYGTMGGEDISAYYSNGVLSIPEVTGAIDVSFQGWADTYTVTTDLGESTLDTDVYVLEHGDEFFGQVTPNEGYKITSMVVTMGGNPVTVTNYGFDILSVTGDVVITVVTEKITHTITNTLTNATNNNTTSPVEYGSQYIANISAAEGYENLTVVVKMGGVDVTSAYYSNGVIIISKVTGDIEITASAVASKVNVSVDVTNVTCSIESQQVDYNSALEFTLTQDDNTFDYVCNVTMGGEEVPVGVGGVYTIEHVIGEIVIEASATKIELVEITATIQEGYELITYGEDFPLQWVTVTAHYNDGTSKEVTSGVTIDETTYDATKVGVQTVTIKALGKETTIDVEVLKSIVVDKVTDVYANEPSYDFGYELDFTDITVLFDTTDGYSHAAAPDCIVDGSYDITKSGDQTVQVVFDGKTYDVVVHINASTEVDSISAVVVDGKEILEYGDPFTIADVVVTVKYTDDLTEEIPAEYVEFVGAPGKNTVVVHAAGKTCTVEVTVKPSEVIDHIDALPNDISYAYGYEFKASDFAVTATYTDAHEGTVDATAIVAEDLVPGLNVVVVKVGELSCNVVVKIDDSTVVDSISAVIKDGKDVVAYEGAFTNGDVTVYATYTDGKTKVVTGFTMSGFDNKHIGVNVVTISLDGKTCTVKVTVLESTVVDHIEAVATKDNLTYGEEFTKDDVKVTEVYTDGHKVENLPADSISGFEGKVGVNEVTVNYGGKSVNIQVTVKPSEVIDSISAVVNEGKSELEYGAPFTKDDVTVTATYTDGHTAVVAADSVDFAGTVGENTVVVHVGDKTCEVKVNVKASEVIVGIEASTEKTEVQYGTNFTKDDVKASYVYSDGHKVDAVVDSISGFNPTQLGKQTITVKVGEYETTIEISVVGRVALSIEVIGYTDKVDQGREYIFDGKVIAHYNDNTSEEVTGYAIEKVDTTSHGPKTVKVSFENVSTTITIKVVQTQTSVDTVGTVAIIGGSVIGVAVLAVGIFFFLKMFKL